MKPFVLIRWTEVYQPHPGEMPGLVVVGVYPSAEAVEARIDRVAAANLKYPMRRLGAMQWVIGPPDDEGFFGDRLVNFLAIPSKEDLTVDVFLCNDEDINTKGTS